MEAAHKTRDAVIGLKVKVSVVVGVLIHVG